MRKQHFLVVGGSRGLGKSFALLALERGHDVSAIARSFSAPQPFAYYARDITRGEEIGPTLNLIASSRGSINGLVFFQRFRSDGDDWDGELRTSLTATRAIIEQAVPMFSPEQSSAIVLVSSVNALFVSHKLPCGYHVAKAGICQMARYFACTLGEKGIRVNAVCPGTYLKPENEQYYGDHPDLKSRFARASPLNRMGTYTEVAHAIFFLLSDESTFITGQSLIVDGGVSLRWQETLLS